MSQTISYEFDEFHLDPVKRSLSYKGELRSLRPIAFELLLVFVANPGQTLTKDEVIRRVWDCDAGDDRNFHVTLHAVRQALRESAQTPSFIVRDATGYRFAADVRIVSREVDQESRVLTSVARDVKVHEQVAYAGVAKEVPIVRPRSRKDYAHVFVASSLYGALYATALILEIAYEFDQFGTSALKIAPLVFAWIMTTATLALTIDRKWTLQGRAAGLTASSLIFLAAAAVLFGLLTRFLPDFAITKASFQTYPAQAACLKDVSYFILLSLLFLILPFHSVAAAERDVRQGLYSSVLRALERKRGAVLPTGEAYLRPWALTSVLLAFAAMSFVMTAHLLDNLKPGSHTNLFTQLVYLRGILYFGLGIVCLWWYSNRLSAMKDECLVKSAGEACARPSGRAVALRD